MFNWKNWNIAFYAAYSGFSWLGEDSEFLALGKTEKIARKKAKAKGCNKPYIMPVAQFEVAKFFKRRVKCRNRKKTKWTW